MKLDHLKNKIEMYFHEEVHIEESHTPELHRHLVDIVVNDKNGKLLITIENRQYDVYILNFNSEELKKVVLDNIQESILKEVKRDNVIISIKEDKELPIRYMNMAQRAYACLMGVTGGIRRDTLGSILEAAKSDLYEYNQLGNASLNTIVDAIEELGYTMKQN